MALFAQGQGLGADQIGGICAAVAAVVGVVILLIVLAVFARFFRLWIQSVTSRAGVGMAHLIGMTFRKVNPAIIVQTKIMAVQAGLGADQIGGICAAVAAVVGVVIRLIVLAVFARFFRLWIQSVTSRAGVGMAHLIGMTFRKVNPAIIVQTKIMAVQAGLGEEEYGITTKALEAHYLAGGRVPLVIQALIAAHKAKTIKLSFREATAIDLAGRNVLESVQTSVYPKVIDCPAKGSARETLDAVAKDGIQLKVKTRVTVRANLQQLIGGATEETIVARVGEGIVSAIGSAANHKVVLENPDRISKAVLARGLDANTAFEIVSIDIADIDVGDNIGARLQADQAEADTRVARARAEQKRAMMVAAEQEQIAEIERSRAAVVEAEAEVPKAMADAFRSGNLGILEYYKLKNIQADTDMRRSIAGAGSAPKTAGQ